MPRITADRIHDGRRFLPPGIALEISEEGYIVALHPDSVGATHYKGVICPGFVNAHCHLELSHMQGVIPRGTGLVAFLIAVMQQRNGMDATQKKAAMAEAAASMTRNGIVAVGDIANTTDALWLRNDAPFHIHTFVECTGFIPDTAASRFAVGMAVFEAFEKHCGGTLQHSQSLAAHAPYSVSLELLERIVATSPRTAIHYLECSEEREFLQNGGGAFPQLFQTLGLDVGFFKGHADAFEELLKNTPKANTLLLVHNTDISKAEVDALMEAHGPNTYWCLCPAANEYIESRMPHAPFFSDWQDHVCLGTDSLASNDQLSILHEAGLLNRHFPQIGWERLLQWATLNGAKALGKEDHVGSLTVGMRPGILLLQGLEEEHPKITRLY